MKWISVKDRLPKQYELVLVFNRNNFYLAIREGIEFYEYKEEYSISVTHWMPLPEPPKEDSND